MKLVNNMATMGSRRVYKHSTSVLLYVAAAMTIISSLCASYHIYYAQKSVEKDTRLNSDSWRTGWAVKTIEFDAEGRFLFVRHYPGIVCLDSSTGEIDQKWFELIQEFLKDREVAHFTTNKTHTHLYVTTQDEDLFVFDITERKLVLKHKMPELEFDNWKLHIGSEWNSWAAKSQRTLSYWHALDEQVVLVWSKPAVDISKVYAAPDSEWLITIEGGGVKTGGVYCRSTTNGEVIGTLFENEPKLGMDFTPHDFAVRKDNQQIAIISGNYHPKYRVTVIKIDPDDLTPGGKKVFCLTLEYGSTMRYNAEDNMLYLIIHGETPKLCRAYLKDGSPVTEVVGEVYSREYETMEFHSGWAYFGFTDGVIRAISLSGVEARGFGDEYPYWGRSMFYDEANVLHVLVGDGHNFGNYRWFDKDQKQGQSFQKIRYLDFAEWKGQSFLLVNGSKQPKNKISWGEHNPKESVVFGSRAFNAGLSAPTGRIFTTNRNGAIKLWGYEDIQTTKLVKPLGVVYDFKLQEYFQMRGNEYPIVMTLGKFKGAGAMFVGCATGPIVALDATTGELLGEISRHEDQSSPVLQRIDKFCSDAEAQVLFIKYASGRVFKADCSGKDVESSEVILEGDVQVEDIEYCPRNGGWLILAAGLDGVIKYSCENQNQSTVYKDTACYVDKIVLNLDGKQCAFGNSRGVVFTRYLK